MRRQVIAVSATVVGTLIAWGLPYYLEVNGTITPDNSHRLLFGSVLGTILIVCVLVWGFWPKGKRIRFHKLVTLEEPEAQGGREVGDAEPESRAMASLKQAPDHTEAYADWMRKAINRDAGDLAGCIKVGEPDICWEPLEETEDTYIEFSFDFWSSSVHLLEISREIEGHIWFGDGELERVPEITGKASQVGTLERSRAHRFTIRQWLPFPVKVRMRMVYGGQVEFDFSRVNVFVVGRLPDGSKSATCRFPLPDVVRAQIGYHPDVPVPGAAGSQPE